MSTAEKISCFDGNLKYKYFAKIIKYFVCYFYLFSFLIGFIETFTYFLSGNMLPSMNFNMVMFSLFIGMMFIFKVSIILVPITAAVFFILKFLFPEKKPFILLSIIALSCLVGSIFFDKSISPKSMIKQFSRGNYSATLVLREEGCKAIKNHSFLKVTPQGTIEDVRVFFDNGETVYLKIDDKLIELSKELILTEIKTNKLLPVDTRLS